MHTLVVVFGGVTFVLFHLLIESCLRFFFLFSVSLMHTYYNIMQNPITRVAVRYQRVGRLSM